MSVRAKQHLTFVTTEVVHITSKWQLLRARGSDDNPVLIKRPRVANGLRLAELHHELALAQRVAGPTILRPLAIHHDEVGPLLCYEHFAGHPLSATLGPSHTLAEIRSIAIAVCKTLVRLHRAGILHKNLHPGAVLVDSSGNIKLTDLSLAAQHSHEEASIDPPARIQGELPYIAPEQTGRMNRAVDARSDLYALGILLYEQIAGSPPFVSDDPMALIHAHMTVLPPPLRDLRPELSPTFEAVILRLLAKNAEDRFDDAEAVLAALVHGHVRPTNSRSQQFRLPQKLYGRDAELGTLSAAFTQAAAGSGVLAVIAGYAGIGKSSLVAELHRPLTAHRGFFAAGKFDQYNAGVPFAPVIAAGTNLLQHILTLGHRDIATWRERLTSGLGLAVPVLAEILPEVQRLLGPQPPPTPLPAAKALHRLQLTLQRFLGVFTTEDHPLILFLDDLQWADGATLRLIETLVTDPSTHHLLLLGAYRDHEVGPDHRLHELLQDLRTNAASPVVEVHLGPLTLHHVASLLRDALGGDDVQDLAGELLRRTGGNPLFVREFLRFLHREELLCYDSVTATWTWDLSNVDPTKIPDNIASLLGDELRRLDPATQHLLQLAACLGTRFDATTLGLVHNTNPTEVARLLQPAIALDLVIPLHASFRLLAHTRVAEDLELEVPLRFLHDRVRQAAYALIPKASRPARHALVGRRMLSRARARNCLHERLFDIVAHLNAGAELLSKAERDEVAGLNLEAARRAKATAAYDTALTLLAAALTHLGPEARTHHRELVFDLQAEQAECEYLSGAFDRALARLEQLAPHVTDLAKRLRLVDLRVVLQASMGNTRAALQAGRLGLAEAGIEIPATEDACREAVAVELARIAEHLHHTPLAERVQAPPVKDPVNRGVLKLLSNLLAPANMTQPQLYALINTKQISLSFEHGHTDISAYTYVVYGYFLATVMHAYAQADEFGRFAVDLNERLGNAALRCRLRFVWATYAHFSRPLRTVLAEFTAALADGRESGDYIYLSSACSHIMISRIGLGEPLSDVSEQADRFIVLMQRTRVASSTAVLTVARQFAAALRGQTVAGHELTGENFDDHAFLTRCELRGLTFAARWYATTKLLLCVLFERHDEAASLVQRYGQAIASAYGFYFTTEFAFYAALATTTRAATADAEVRPQLAATLAAYADQLAGWAHACPENFGHKADLVAAERAALTGDVASATNLYDRAIAQAQAAGFVGHAALACELAARFHRRLGHTTLARLLVREAYSHYHRWGATAKLAHLRRNFGTDLAHEDLPEDRETTASELHNPDLRSVIRAFQAFAAALRLEDLIRAVMDIVVVAANATRAVLVLADDHVGLRLVGAAIAHGPAPELGEVALDRSDDVPAAPLRLAFRTGCVLSLDDAEHARLFAQDPYIGRVQPRSLLCLPLVVQGQSQGVLYLENTVTAGAFTAARRQILAMLSTQIAISLEHAQLYARLEHARAAAEAASKTKSTFLANMSHELRTPLNAILGYADLLLEDNDDLSEQQCEDLGRIQRAGRHLLEIISDILDISKIEADKLEVIAEEFALQGLLEEVIETITPAMQHNSNRLNYHPPPRLGNMHSDPVRLRQVLLNLLSNAAKFTQQGEVTLTVLHLGERICFSVRDTGIGMTPAQAERVFDAFHQVDASTTRQVGGTGLGLTITRRLCHLLGGDVRVASAPGLGSEFTIELPVRIKARTALSQ